MISKIAAESIGTFWLVLGGFGSAVLAAGFPGLRTGFVGVSLAFGLTVLTGAYALGPISGGHFNPAVSIGLWAGGQFPGGQLLPYIVAQVVGGIAAAAVLYLIASGPGWGPARQTLRRPCDHPSLIGGEIVHRLCEDPSAQRQSIRADLWLNAASFPPPGQPGSR